MGIREAINKKRWIGAVITVVLLVAALGFVWAEMSSMDSGDGIQRLFYTVDEGATLFADTAGRHPPFEHEGKPAVLAHVFTCKQGKQFVGYLERYDAPSLKIMLDLETRARTAKPGDAPPDLNAVRNASQYGREVKAMDGKAWVPINSAEGRRIVNAVSCPNDAGGRAEPVVP